MRIEKLIIRNFRQLRDIEIVFEKKTVNDLHIFVARNGSGKTNIMNAINWCLYNKEPHLSKESDTLPLLNLKAIKESSEKDIKVVSVELFVKTEDNKTLIFTRNAHFRIGKKGEFPSLLKNELEVKTKDDSGNTQIIEGEETDSYVKRFVPQGIKEFFFFDGERLDKYFIDATGEKISQAIFEISQIHLLSDIERKLKDISKEISKEATANNPDLEKKNNDVDVLEKKQADISSQISECNHQITTAKEHIKMCTEYLSGLPDIEKEEKRRKQLSDNRDIKKKSLADKLKVKQDILLDLSKLLYLLPTIKSSLDIINEKRLKKELPPNIDSEFLKNVLKEKHCLVCNRPLDSNSEQKINELIKEIKTSSEIGQKLLEIENPLKMQLLIIKKLEKDIKSVTQDIIEIQNDLTSIEKELNEIDKALDGFQDKDKIKEKHEERKKFEQILEDSKERSYMLSEQAKSVESNLEKAREDLKQALAKDKKSKALQKQLEFCNNAKDVVIKTKNGTMSETRKKIETETKNNFLNLVWKKETFKDVIIKENYNIALIHQMDYECLGSISAAERELLALSFTLALHKVSGFDASLIIDTPVARVSDTNRENFGNVLLDVSKNKQTILLFAPDEYSSDISNVFEGKYSNKYILKVDTDEKQTIMEVV